MKNTFNYIMWRLFSLFMFVLLLIIVVLYFFIDWDFSKIIDWLIDFMKIAIPVIIAAIIIYNLFIERVLLWNGRRETGRIVVEELPSSIQKDGKKRSGKDASDKAEAIAVREYLKRKYKNELKVLREKMYLYDFKKYNNYLDEHYESFFVATEDEMKRIFLDVMKKNDAFICEHWITKDFTPKIHINHYKFKKGIYVPHVPFKDGIVPGGKHMFDLLFRYTVLYVRFHYIPNYVLANQPFIEDYRISKDGKITTLWAKMLSQDFMKIKDPNAPIPYVPGMYWSETETGMLISNTDTKLNQEIKNESGIREFHTVFGHLFEEEAMIRGITQKKTRPNITVRELYEAYMHVFRFEFKQTSDFFRSFYIFFRFIRRIKILRLKITKQTISYYFRAIHFLFIYVIRLINATRKYLRINPKTSFKLLQKVRSIFKMIIRKIALASRIENRYDQLIMKMRKKQSHNHQKELQLWAKGYIIFYIGLYDNIEDSGKVVKFPLLWGLKKNKKNSEYGMYGFKQIAKITDTFGRYSTHYMKSVREIKNMIANIPFTDIPNWKSFSMESGAIRYVNYKVLKELIFALFDRQKSEKREKEKAQREEQQKRIAMDPPDLSLLKNIDVMYLCIDYGIQLSDNEVRIMSITKESAEENNIELTAELKAEILANREKLEKALSKKYIDYYNNLSNHKNSWGMY